MKKPYFVMVYTSDKEGAWPLEDKWTDVAFFETENKARRFASKNKTACRWGFEVLKIGTV